MEIVADEAALAHRAAERFVEAARGAIAARGTFAVTLAGGSTPKAAFDLLAAMPLRERVAWKNVRFYFGDERCVPPDHADSNYGMARAHLFAPLGIAETSVFRMRGEDEPSAAAAEYEALLRRELGEAPVFDLVMLGMGPDGHTASLFPGTLAGIDPQRLVVAHWVAKMNSNRITLTPRAINAARAIDLSAGGAAKADVLVKVLEGPEEPDLYPSQILDPSSGTLTWIVDRAAAGALSASTLSG
ncbi:MAG: 6-phosphogluconolactonase [Candidatus Eremiobacteraeota bacterium]|nr:6-phosphogluconolactonase [Candidatus Eremiobacteraeota bacterium]